MPHVMIFLFVSDGHENPSPWIFARYIHVIVVSESFRPSVWYVWGYTKGSLQYPLLLVGWHQSTFASSLGADAQIADGGSWAPKFVAKHWSKKGPLTNPRYYWLLVVGYWFLGCWLLVVVGWLLSHIFQFNKCRPEPFHFLNSRYAVGCGNLLSRACFFVETGSQNQDCSICLVFPWAQKDCGSTEYSLLSS